MHLFFFMSQILCHIIIIIITGMCTSACIFCVSNYFGLRKTRPDWGASWIVVFHTRGNKQVSSITLVREAVRGRAGSGDWGLPWAASPRLGAVSSLPRRGGEPSLTWPHRAFGLDRETGGSPRPLTAFSAVTLSAPRVTGRGLWGRGF